MTREQLLPADVLAMRPRPHAVESIHGPVAQVKFFYPDAGWTL
jgi:hypothetical protein